MSGENFAREPSLPPSVNKVIEAAKALGLSITPRLMPASTRTAQEAAAACGCAVAQIVKSLVFTGATSGRTYLLLVSGANRVDEKAAARHLGEALKRPDAERVRETTGFAIGGVPPLGHATPSPVWLDQDLLGFDLVWAAAGHPNAVFPIDPRELARATGATAVKLS
ncbi:MAG: YbaK/EbsC family protein [Hyphomicrobiales bacterium]|nr:YbaK/EbsC family protein [Hyphomicrobiales bacterium]